MESMTCSTEDYEINHTNSRSVSAAEAGLDLHYGTMPPSSQVPVEVKEKVNGCCHHCFKIIISVLTKHLMMFMGLALGTYIGVSIRVGLPKVYTLDGFASFLPQLVGTSIMGIFMAHKESAMQAGVCCRFIYTAITTGVCGSLTTFSSWNVDASKFLLNLNETDLQPMYHMYISTNSVVGFLIIIMLGLGMPIAVFRFSKNVSNFLVSGTIFQCSGFILRYSSAIHSKIKWLFPAINVVLYIIATSVSVVIVYFYTYDYATLFALVLGTPATYIRWCLGGLDKRCSEKFPIGTFIANITGSLILSVTLVIVNYTSTVLAVGNIPMAILSGIAVGFCGSLTTVSTFVSQLCSLSFRMSLLYTCLSLVLSQAIVNAVFIIYSLFKF